MNFLAHAWTLGEQPAAELVLGAALPDLAGAFDRKRPRLALEAAARFEHEGAPLLARGVRAHQAADACFHELPAFKQLCASLRTQLAPLELERVRGFFLAHLLVEVLLDAALLDADRSLVDRFYAALEAAPRARAAHLVASDAAASLERFLDRFVRARFLDDYATDEGAAHRVEQVLSRARQTLGAGGKERLVAALPAMRALVAANVAALTDEPRRAVLAV